MRFKLELRRWYACELIGDEFEDDICSYSPIKIAGIEPLESGNRTLILHFYHANYPEGVRNKTYKLRMIERGERYLLLKSLDHNPTRFLQIYGINSEWITKHFPGLDPDRDDVQTWLNDNM